LVGHDVGHHARVDRNLPFYGGASLFLLGDGGGPNGDLPASSV
jgi:hypothetical protein